MRFVRYILLGMRALLTKARSLMNAPFDPTLLMNEKFAVGQPVSRKEDPVLLRGEGRYTDDLNCPASSTASWSAAGWRMANCARSMPTPRVRCRACT